MRQKIKARSLRFMVIARLPLAVAISVVLSGGVWLSVAHADQYTNQIQQLQSQNAQAQSSVNSLQAQASSYQNAIDLLQSQITSMQQNIQSNENEQTQVQQQIVSGQNQIVQQKQVLGNDIKAMYVGGQMTTIEELATSKSLSAFVDAQTYRNAVQNKIQTTLVQINTLEDQLKTQQQQIQTLLQTQQTQQTQLTADQQQQSSLLAMNQQQQAQYTQQIQTNNTQIAQLHQEEIAANQSGVKGTSSGGGPCGGSGSATYNGVTYTYANTYPTSLCAIPQDSATDQWGMLNRECVSYTAWMEFSTGHNVPYGLGNATDWPSNVPSSWVSSTPQVGDIAIRPAVPGLTVDGESDVGHAMYVEKVIDSDTIVVSEYNENLNGDFSVQVRSIDAPYNGYQDNLVFINFPS